MRRRLPTLASIALLATGICVGSAEASTGISSARAFVPGEVVLKLQSQGRGRTVELAPGVGVRRAVAALRQRPGVAYAAPNYIARASQREPLLEPEIANDPGPLATTPGPPGGWVTLQWNFLPWEGTGTASLPISAGGIDAIGAWRNLARAGRRGAQGTTVAVLDTGIAYRNYGGGYRRSPDFSPGQFAKGHDFVDSDRLPLDQNGHGTHVAGTIAEKTNNGIGLVGLAAAVPIEDADRHQLRSVGESDQTDPVVGLLGDRAGDVGAVAVLVEG